MAQHAAIGGGFDGEGQRPCQAQAGAIGVDRVNFAANAVFPCGVGGRRGFTRRPSAERSLPEAFVVPFSPRHSFRTATRPLRRQGIAAAGLGWRQVAAEAGLLGASGGAAVAIHRLVADGGLSDRASLAAAAATALALVAAVLVTARAAWRRRAWRARAAACALPFGLALTCAAFVWAGLMDASVEMEALIEAGEPPAAATTIVVGPGGRDVRFAGPINEGVAQRLGDLLAAHPEVTRIHLTSEGGLADEGQALGDVIAAHGLATFAPDFCVSACTLAFVRGRERIMEEDGRLGFHAPYEQGLFGKLYRGDSGAERAAYLAAGVAPGFVDAALKVDPSDMWFPGAAELLAAHAVTAMVDRDRLPDSRLDGADTLEGARSLVTRDFPLVGVFLERSPKAIDAIAGWYLDAYRAARSEGENGDALARIVRSAVASGLSRADDDALPDLARYFERALAVAATPRACAAIAGRADLLAAAKAIEDVDGKAGAAAARALFDRALGGSHVPGTPAQVAAPPPDDATSCAQWRQRVDRVARRGAATVLRDLRATLDVEAQASLVVLRSVQRPQAATAGTAVAAR